MKYYSANRCSICGATIPKGQMRCAICKEEYPCSDCDRKDKSTCMCRQWKRWFHAQWERFYRPRKGIQKPLELQQISPENNEKPSE